MTRRQSKAVVSKRQKLKMSVHETVAKSENAVSTPLKKKSKGKCPKKGGRKEKNKGGDVVRKVIIDTDPGTDDAMAILMLLNDKDIQVLAITVTQGNATLENTSRNALRVANVANRKDIPIYAGAESSLLNDKVESDNYYGKDGMGDVETEFDEDLGRLEVEKAVPALIRLVEEHKGEVTLLCIGPLTNIAIAQKIDSKFGSKLMGCFIMGGNCTGRGNITSSAEFNFYRDPEAASIVLKELDCAITLIPWELCDSLNLDWDWYEKITSKRTRISRFLNEVGAEMVKNARAANQKWYTPSDELAAACLLKDKEEEKEYLALDTQDAVCRVEVAGFMTRGQVVLDWKSSDKKPIKIIKKVDVEMFKTMMEELTSTDMV